MIVVKLLGGLGNQMFQYAAGRSAALYLNTALKLDIRGFESEGVTKRKYELNIFNITEDFAADKELNKIIINSNILHKHFPRLILRTEKLFGYSRIKDVNNPSRFLNSVTENSYLDGTFASEFYFRNIKSVIKDDFTFKKPPNKPNLEMISKISNSNSVSVHIRRGDYVSNSKVKQIYASCSLDYYKSAMKNIEKKVKNPQFFIFSDDTEWIKANFKEKNNTLVTHNNKSNNYEDLRLMSHCKHNIIANSTFSWWGAWLNSNTNKIVIAPKVWYLSKFKIAPGLIPPEWIKL